MKDQHSDIERTRLSGTALVCFEIPLKVLQNKNLEAPSVNEHKLNQMIEIKCSLFKVQILNRIFQCPHFHRGTQVNEFKS